MGIIFRCEPPAERPDLDFPLVMKVPRLGSGEPGETVVTYEVETMVHAALPGPHVPRFVAAGDLADRPYLVMEFVEGTSLKAWAERAPLPVEEVARLGAAVASAVHSLHVQEVVHLDLKPANVIIRPTARRCWSTSGWPATPTSRTCSPRSTATPWARAPTSRPSRCWACAGTRAATSSRWGSSSTSSPPASTRTAPRPPRPACGAGSGTCPCRRGASGPRCRSGCRRSSCAAWRPRRPTATPRRRRWRATSSTRTRSR